MSSGFSIADLATRAVYLSVKGVPSSMLWQTLMGLHFLQPYGLFPASSADWQPATLFSDDETTLQTAVTGPNPALADVPAYLVAQVAGQGRPYLLSVAGMFVTIPGSTSESSAVKMLAPVQSTPILAGILPAPSGAVDVGGQSVGGSAVTSFAFNSVFQSSDRRQRDDPAGPAMVADGHCRHQQRGLRRHARKPDRRLVPLAPAVRRRDAPAQGRRRREARRGRRVRRRCRRHAGGGGRGGGVGGFDAAKGQLGGLAVLTGLVPKYDYWSPAFPPSADTAKLQAFADGGSLDNTGVTSMLLYPGITSIVAFVNTENAIKLENGTIVVDSSIPALFGLQGYSSKTPSPYMPASEAPTSDLQPHEPGVRERRFRTLAPGPVGQHRRRRERGADLQPATRDGRE